MFYITCAPTEYSYNEIKEMLNILYFKGNIYQGTHDVLLQSFQKADIYYLLNPQFKYLQEQGVLQTFQEETIVFYPDRLIQLAGTENILMHLPDECVPSARTYIHYVERAVDRLDASEFKTYYTLLSHFYFAFLEDEEDFLTTIQELCEDFESRGVIEEDYTSLLENLTAQGKFVKKPYGYRFEPL